MDLPENVFKQRLANKEKLIGSWLMSGSPASMGLLGDMNNIKVQDTDRGGYQGRVLFFGNRHLL